MNAVSSVSVATVSDRGQWGRLLYWFAASRLIILASLVVLHTIGPHGTLGDRFFRSPLGLLGAWDGAWYATVARHGYLLLPGKRSDTAFFPFYPILMREVHTLGLSFLTAGVLVANAAFVVAVVLFHELGRFVVPAAVAFRASVLLMITPMAYVFSMTYPESLVLALGLASLLAAYHDRWLLAAALVALAGLTRPEALMFAAPLASRAWACRRTLDPARRRYAWTAVLAAPAAVASFVVYLGWALADMNAWSEAEARWGRGFSPTGLFHTFADMPSQISHTPLLARDVVLTLAYLAGLVLAKRAGIGRGWIACGLLIIVLPLFTGTIESEGRFGLLSFPFYWGAASLRLTRRVEVGLVACSAALLSADVIGLRWIWP